MKPIPAVIVAQTAQELANLSVRQGEQLAQRFIQEQPMLMSYLMAVDNDLLNEEERELLFYLGTTIWQMMSHGDAPLPQVTEQMLEQAEAANRQTLESLAGASDADARTGMETMLNNFSQPEVFKYIVTTLMESPQEEGIRQDNLGVLMVDLKTVIDCLNWKLVDGN